MLWDRHDFRLSTWTARSGLGYCANACNKCSCRSAWNYLSTRTGLSQKKLAWITPNSKVLVIWHEYTDVAHFQTDYQPVAIPARSLQHFINATVTHNCFMCFDPSLKNGQNEERKTRVPERAFRTQRGGYSDLLLPEASHNLFCSLQEGSAVSHNFFNHFSRSVSTTELIALRWNLWEVRTFFFQWEKGSGKESWLAPQTWWGQNLFCFTQKKVWIWEDQHPRLFLVASSTILFRGKKVSVSRPRKYINFGLLEKTIHSERAFRNASF